VVQERIKILDVPFDNISMTIAVKRIANFFVSGQPHQIVTANPETVMLAQEDGELLHILQKADLVVADGIGIVGAARYLGTPLPERVAGIELAEMLLSFAAQNNFRTFFLGGAPGVAAEAAQVIQKRYPKLVISGVHHGYFNQAEEKKIIQQIKDCRPHFLLVGMGVPKQEKWIWHYKEELNIPVAMGVGGSFDVFAGRVTRAPRWTQRLGMEWLYRLLSQPQRLSRMQTLPQFVLQVLCKGKE
jgi:N-acetylglucosaminyldiphosphoundecaprenol N-acetyl-beta-D-mannosaminyltransferase